MYWDLSATISGFSVAANGSLAAISGSPFSVAHSVEAVTDASGKFLFAVNASSVLGFYNQFRYRSTKRYRTTGALPGSTLPSPGFAATTL